MMGHLHAALNAVADEAAEPSPPPPPPAPPRAPETETPGRRLARIAHESEFVGNGERAARVHATRIALAESAAAAGGAGGSWDVGAYSRASLVCTVRARRQPFHIPPPPLFFARTQVGGLISAFFVRDAAQPFGREQRRPCARQWASTHDPQCHC